MAETKVDKAEMARRILSEAVYVVRLWFHCLTHFHRSYLTCYLTGDVERGCADCDFRRYEGEPI